MLSLKHFRSINLHLHIKSFLIDHLIVILPIYITIPVLGYLIKYFYLYNKYPKMSVYIINVFALIMIISFFILFFFIIKSVITYMFYNFDFYRDIFDRNPGNTYRNPYSDLNTGNNSGNSGGGNNGGGDNNTYVPYNNDENRRLHPDSHHETNQQGENIQQPNQQGENVQQTSRRRIRRGTVRKDYSYLSARTRDYLLERGMPVGDTVLTGRTSNTVTYGLNSASTFSEEPTTNISRSNVSMARIPNTNISNTNIPSTNVSNPYLSNANVSTANVSNPYLSNANVSTANVNQPTVSSSQSTVSTNANVTSTVTDNSLNRKRSF